MKSVVRSCLAVRSKMNFFTETYFLLLSEFPGFSTVSCDVPLLPLCCIYTIDKFFITTVMEPEIKKHISLILLGLFQHFSRTTIKYMFNSKVIHASTYINIGSIIIEKPASCDTSIYLMGIVSTSSKTIGNYNITFSYGSVSFVKLATKILYFHYVVPNILFYNHTRTLLAQCPIHDALPIFYWSGIPKKKKTHTHTHIWTACRGC